MTSLVRRIRRSPAPDLSLLLLILTLVLFRHALRLGVTLTALASLVWVTAAVVVARQDSTEPPTNVTATNHA